MKHGTERFCWDSVQTKEYPTTASAPLRRIKVTEQVIGSARGGQAFLLPSDALGQQSSSVPLVGSEVNCARFQLFLQLQKGTKKGGLGRTWAREHLRLILVLRNKH